MIKSMAKVIVDGEKIQDLLFRGVAEIIDRQHLEQELRSGKKLRVKLGIDPTSPKLHIGRAVVLWKLREFQDLGHTAVFIIGDATGVVGDTSDKDSERPMLTEGQVKSNMKTYFDQAFKILDQKKTETHYNSEWLKKLGLLELAKIANLFGFHEIASREVIAKRLEAGKRVSLHEVLYSIMQGYDSVAVKADVELGGADQRFNLLTGRRIQPLYGQESQDILMINLLEGTDGRKMSSSWGNVINIIDEPDDMFGKAMSISDDLVVKYFEYATRLPMAEVKLIEKELAAGANPRDIKKRLAKELVALYHGKKAAADAFKEWTKVFSRKEKPAEIPEFSGRGMTLLDFMVKCGLAESRSKAKQLFDQGAIRINDEVAKARTNWDYELKEGDNIQVGPRRFIKVSK